ncbi:MULTISPECIES: hypothetical protein [Legionella]|uniref:Cofactor-independent phosphoglycerate mutase n=1 Tax=Legionella septentrionalis TaxID=2498109 RepID=A0A433JKX5_9GAMM|nr:MULTISPECIES: hypothetical protein [Legionella]MCP0913487.1 hypothetical protein [Legionella sp. 27cVA30]RUQ89737.1 hypothetical protein EKM59_02975 [Legionella septentrionalis]RUR11088.1 hypothetical protein ELY14_03195 [Legionella septentrionalis]RUR15250.1 hypothetical protein ELY10_06500 [Legionella septentrionalis]
MDVVINAEIQDIPRESLELVCRGNFYHHVLTCLGYPESSPPIADLLRRLYGLAGEWLMVSPVHWQASHNDAMILASGREMQLSEAESQQWFAVLGDFVAPEGMTVYYCDRFTWLLQAPGKPSIQAKPVQQLLHQSLMPQLRNLDASFFWQRFITESQMFFSAHPLHQKNPGPAVNGLWIWGGGMLDAPQTRFIHYNSEFTCNLAKHLSTQATPYQSSQLFGKNDLLLLDTIDSNLLLQLQSQLRKDTVHWYWNNLAYTTQAKSWWSRLWS